MTNVTPKVVPITANDSVAVDSSSSTQSIFNFAVCENYVTGQNIGLSLKIAEGMGGWASNPSNCNCVDDYLQNVQSYAENFVDGIKSVLDDLMEDDDASESDILILREMLTWTYDPAELERLVHEDWADMSEQADTEKA